MLFYEKNLGFLCSFSRVFRFPCRIFLNFKYATFKVFYEAFLVMFLAHVKKGRRSCSAPSVAFGITLGVAYDVTFVFTFGVIFYITFNVTFYIPFFHFSFGF